MLFKNWLGNSTIKFLLLLNYPVQIGKPRALGTKPYVSCYVVLPALCHLEHTIDISVEDTAYMIRCKAAFTKHLSQCKAKFKRALFKTAIVLNQRFKNFVSTQRRARKGMEQPWSNAARAHCHYSTEQPWSSKDGEIPDVCPTLLQMKNRGLIGLCASRAEPTIRRVACPVMWWSSHAGWPNWR